MSELIKKQNFGVEIEMTGITRQEAAKVIAAHYNTNATYIGTYYQTYGATDTKGRTWKAMSDSSIRTEKKSGGSKVSAGDAYSCEVVTPILQYEDMEDLQQIIRELVKAGALVNESCGIHVHVDGAKHTPESLTRLLNFATGRQDLFYEALQIGARGDRWCRKIDKSLLNAMKHGGNQSRSAAERTWYSSVNSGYTGGINHEHYNSTRYHGINLHAFFTKGTVEFRLFNGTLHAGTIKAYVQFCLAMSAWAIECKNDNLFFKSIDHMTTEQKGKLMERVLKNRLGLRGPEYKTCRLHLTAAFKTGSEETAA